ncbi:hypothetical protein [Pseudomonas putida]|uniref:hypothetical protein n=1 Tax=Pseudomonas putida TaxID=303 RepID=UPI0016511A2B|nr:hypothetical protein [Pseudomonas putida]
MAPALPVIAGKPAPTGLASAVEIEYVSATEGVETAWMPFDQAGAVPFVGRLAGDAGAAVHGTGFAGDRRQAGSYRVGVGCRH